MKSKFWTLVAFLTVMPFILLGCGTAPPVPEAGTEDDGSAISAQISEFDPNMEVTIVVPQPTFYDAESAAAAFMEKYPNVTIEFGAAHSASQDEAAFLTKAAAGEVDDVFGGGDENPDMYGPRGIYIDLKPYMEQDADLWFDDDKFMNWWIYTNPDGAIYSVPTVGNPMIVAYNKDMVEAAGLALPPATYDDPAYADWTWDTFREYAVALTDPDSDVWGVGIENNILVYWPFIYSNSGQIVNDDLTDYLIDDPKVVETFDFLTSFALEGYAPDPSAAQELGGMNDLFQNQKVAMIPVGGWMAGGAWSNAKEDFGFEVGLAALPYNTTSDNIVLCPAMRQGISSVSEHPEVAYEWLKFLYFEADDIHRAWDGWSPWTSTVPRHDLYNAKIEEGGTVHGKWGPAEEKLDFLMNDHCGPKHIMNVPPWNGPFPETRDITLAEMGLVYSGEQTLEEAIANINDQADLVMLRWQQGAVANTCPILKEGDPACGSLSFNLASLRVLSRGDRMRLSFRHRQYISGYLFISMPLLGVLIFSIYPLVSSIYNSFFIWNAINPRQYVGAENYTFMLTLDKQVITSLRATLIYLLFHIPAVAGGGLFFAVLLNNRRLKGLRLARTAVITPLVTASMAIAAVWLFVFNPHLGLLNAIIQEWFGGEPLNWYGKPHLAMIVLLVVSIWRGIGYSFIFLLAGLQNIPVQLQEAAKIDGANAWQLFWRITFPLLTPSIFLVLVLLFLGAAQEFEMPLVLTEGGPRWTTSLINLTIYNIAFDYSKVGYASAIATFAFLFLLLGTILQFYGQRKWVHYEN